MEKEILDLVVKAKWYDLIKDGYKREEYRAITPYWCRRILYAGGIPIPMYYWNIVLSIIKTPSINVYSSPTYVRFRRGYTKESMLFKIDSIEIGLGKSDLGAPAEEVFIIKFSDYGSNKR